MNEIDLPLEIAIPLLLVLSILAIYQWHHIGHFKLDIEPKTTAEDKDTDQALKERYGAYIQLAGRRYN